MGSQVFLPAADSRSPVDLEAELVRLHHALPHGPSRTRLALRRLQAGQALRFGRQESAAVGPWAPLMGQVQATQTWPRPTLLVNAILPSENPGPFSVKYYKQYGFV